MKRQIRRNVFETNSSSTHAICISKKNISDKGLPSHLKFTHGKFGWNFNILDSVEERASYLYQAICDLCYGDRNKKLKYEFLGWLRYTLSKYGVECEFETSDDEDGYIDHADETADFVLDILSDEHKLMRYLFSDSVIITGNDNDGSNDNNNAFRVYMGTHKFNDYEIYHKGN